MNASNKVKQGSTSTQRVAGATRGDFLTVLGGFFDHIVQPRSEGQTFASQNGLCRFVGHFLGASGHRFRSCSGGAALGGVGNRKSHGYVMGHVWTTPKDNSETLLESESPDAVLSRPFLASSGSVGPRILGAGRNLNLCCLASRGGGQNQQSNFGPKPPVETMCHPSLIAPKLGYIWRNVGGHCLSSVDYMPSVA